MTRPSSAIVWAPSGDGWLPIPLAAESFDLAAHDQAPGIGVPRHVRVRRAQLSGRPDSWALIVSSKANVRVNGERVPLGLRMLTDKDEIRIGGRGSYYFSTEQLAIIRPFPAVENEVQCPRCKMPLEAGKPAVQCPGSTCGFWHHQVTPDRACWTYADTCALCPHPTVLGGTYQWTPDCLHDSV